MGSNFSFATTTAKKAISMSRLLFPIEIGPRSVIVSETEFGPGEALDVILEDDSRLVVDSCHFNPGSRLRIRGESSHPALISHCVFNCASLEIG